MSRACDCFFLVSHPEKSSVSSVSRSVSFPQKTPVLPCKRAAHSHTRATALRLRRHCRQVWMRSPCKIDVYCFSKEIYNAFQKRCSLLLKRDVYCFSKEICVASQRLCAAETALRSNRVLSHERNSTSARASKSTLLLKRALCCLATEPHTNAHVNTQVEEALQKNVDALTDDMRALDASLEATRAAARAALQGKRAEASALHAHTPFQSQSLSCALSRSLACTHVVQKGTRDESGALHTHTHTHTHTRRAARQAR